MTTYSLDFTRHVRTEAGAKRYHKPIGSPIGGDDKIGGSGKSVDALAAELGNSIGRMLVENKRSVAKHPGAAMRTAPSMPTTYAEHHAAAKRAARPRTKSSHGDDKSNLYQLDPERMQAAINDPNTPKDRKNAMRVIAAQRKATAARVLAAKPGLKDYAKKNEAEYENNPSKFFAGLYKIAPWLKPHMEVLRKGKTGETAKTVKKKSADHLIDVAIEIIAKAALAGVAIKLGLGA